MALAGKVADLTQQSTAVLMMAGSERSGACCAASLSKQRLSKYVLGLRQRPPCKPPDEKRMAGACKPGSLIPASELGALN